MWVGWVNRDVGFSIFSCAQAKNNPDQPFCLRDAKSLVQSLVRWRDAGVLTSSATNGHGRGVCGQRKDAWRGIKKIFKAQMLDSSQAMFLMMGKGAIWIVRTEIKARATSRSLQA